MCSYHSYGVSRVYSQQCGYVLMDAQNAQNSMKALLKVVRTAELDPDAGKARYVGKSYRMKGMLIIGFAGLTNSSCKMTQRSFQTTFFPVSTLTYPL